MCGIGRGGENEPVLLQFIGGACDGLEEVSVAAPRRVVRSPGAHDLLEAPWTRRPWDDEPTVTATYELYEIDASAEVARYQPASG